MCAFVLVSGKDFASAKLSLNIKMHARVLSSKQLFTSLLSLNCSLTAVGWAVLLLLLNQSLQQQQQQQQLTAVGGAELLQQALLQQVPDNLRGVSADIHRNTHL